MQCENFNNIMFWQKFREINLVILHYYMILWMFSRNFLQKRANYHSWSKCGNYGNLLSHIFDENFVKPTFFLKELLKSWFPEIFFPWDTVWKLWKFTRTFFWQIFREINAFTKELIWRNIFSMRVNFAFFHTVKCELVW